MTFNFFKGEDMNMLKAINLSIEHWETNLDLLIGFRNFGIKPEEQETFSFHADSCALCEKMNCNCLRCPLYPPCSSLDSPWQKFKGEYNESTQLWTYCSSSSKEIYNSYRRLYRACQNMIKMLYKVKEEYEM
jgi:hypothetical protein